MKAGIISRSSQRRHAEPQGQGARFLLHLQRTAGNQAVNSLLGAPLQRQAEAEAEKGGKPLLSPEEKAEFRKSVIKPLMTAARKRTAANQAAAQDALYKAAQAAAAVVGVS